MMMLRSLLIYLLGIFCAHATMGARGDWQAVGLASLLGALALVALHFSWPVRANHV